MESRCRWHQHIRSVQAALVMYVCTLAAAPSGQTTPLVMPTVCAIAWLSEPRYACLTVCHIEMA